MAGRASSAAVLAVFAAVLAAGIASAAPLARPGGFSLTAMDDEAMDGYIVWAPVGYDPSKAYPVILSIHSSGETGGTVRTALVHGPGRALKDPSPRFDALRSSFIIVFPHLKEGEYTERQWFDRTGALDALLTRIMDGYSCDPSRLYLLGYSTGGTGSWGYASSHPLDFAAIIPEAGFTRPDLGLKKPIVREWANLRDVPIWAFYNVFDKAVHYNHITQAVEAIEATGGEPFVRLTHGVVGPEFRGSVIVDVDPAAVLGVGRIWSSFRIGIHSQGDLWQNPLLYDWLLSHRNESWRGGIIARAIAERDRRRMR
ncbi:MAG: hypothetical protein KKA67_06620 [Spirochaetes bacterium]|nr:hypothetical protein [Spirochaetota bacterium]